MEYRKRELFYQFLEMRSKDSDWNSYNRTLAQMLESETIKGAV